MHIFYFYHLTEVGPYPFSRGKPSSSDSNCNTALGVKCCGGEENEKPGEASARCCPDGLCIECKDTNDHGQRTL